jgi:hypothetical protein
LATSRHWNERDGSIYPVIKCVQCGSSARRRVAGSVDSSVKKVSNRFRDGTLNQ